jgi:hypothetical protein
MRYQDLGPDYLGEGLAWRARQLTDEIDGADDHVRQDPHPHLEADAG